MQPKKLRSYYALPDYSNYVVHFTGRKGGQMGLPADVKNLALRVEVGSGA